MAGAATLRVWRGTGVSADAESAPARAGGGWGRNAAIVLAIGALRAASLTAQVDPSARWETLHTEHFRVHFNPFLEEQARRAAVNAEWAYAALARELTPPRGPIDLVLADNMDASNGQSTPFPTNRIIVYAYPPVDASGLRYYGDWNAILIQHELTHIFHLDRARGWWRLAQRIFGRNPVFMPNLYTPAWITEGLAVYYESRLTGFGRLNGSAHRTIADAAAGDSALPRLDQLSLIAPQWPNGDGPYVYGSLLFSYLADTRGPATVPEFIERSSGEPIPFLLDHVSRAAFGISFEDAWKHWRDSVQHAVIATPDLHALAWRTLSREGYDVEHPRWLDSATIVYGTDTERDASGAYDVTLSGREHRIGRRNGVSYNVPGPDGLVYSQLDYTSPYDLRMDLYRSAHGHETRLTHGARFTDPDVRHDGRLVAIWVHDASSQIVLLSRDGRRRRPITPISPDTEWSQPHWSPDGTRIAAVRWERGGYMAVVLLDTAGTVEQVYARERSVVTSPAWAPDGTHLLFTSDRGGRPDLYQISLGSPESPDSTVTLIGGAAAGVSDPAISPDGRMVAVSELRGDGDHIAVARYDPAAGFPVGPDSSTEGDRMFLPPVGRDTGRATRYSPWSGLLPRYWMPVANSSDQGFFQLGAYTSGSDVLQRHAYALDVLYDFRQPSQIEWSSTYEYRGLGLPVVDLGANEYWTHDPIANTSGQTVGLLAHRTITLSTAATLLRPRWRNSATWTVGADLELRSYHTDPGSLLANIDPFYASSPTFPSIFTTASWTNAVVPDLSISPEDGISLSGTARLRRQDAATTATERSFVGIADAYKALDLPGFAHHVIAARIALGIENDGAISTFTAGGRSGESLEIIPGLTVGDQPRVFSVRGYPLGSAQGTRAVAGSLEYRVPLWESGRGWHLLPIFLGKTSVSLFSDAGEAWCPSRTGLLSSVCSASDARRRLLNSVGAELNFVAALQYDVPYQLRVGFAAPTANRQYYAASPVGFYVTFGLPF